ncbi:MAG: fasciclin domain-containing protein [Flavobacteriia bacterium]
MKKLRLIIYSISGAIFLSAPVFAQTNVFDDVIATSPNHNYLEAALIQEGLDITLKDPTANYTVFAPDDQAFTDLATALNTDIAGLLALPNLSDILLYHVIGSEVLSTDLSNGLIASPLNTANTLKVTIDGANVFVNQAQVSAADLQTDNGAVHVLDAVVLPNTTVADIAIGSPAETTLVAAVIEARLLPALTDPFSQLTVFAPTNSAFNAALSALGITAAQLLASPDLADILLYHVIGSEVLSTDLSNGLIASPLNTANTLKVTIDGTNVFVNQAQVSAADLQADNGAVHVLDAVVLPNTTVADIAIGSPAHTTLVAAVIEARLLPALTNPFSQLTVFAPTNDAFNAALTALGITAPQLLASPLLQDILLYHVIGSEVLSSDLSNGMIASPLNTANTLKVTIDGTSVFVNQAQVVGADLSADNGVVHVLGEVVLPVETVADIAIGSSAHTTLVAAVIEARLLPLLTDPFSEFTVFAPTNTAFNNLATSLGLTLNDILALPNLADILAYHVVSGTVLSTDLTAGPVPTLSGDNVIVSLTGGVKINDANVTTADLISDNGVVHVLDRVLLSSFLGIDEATSPIVNVYPNPFIESLSISGMENAEYTIVDNSGKIVLNGKLNQAEVISTANLSAGVYTLSVSNNNTIEKRQIVKQK